MLSDWLALMLSCWLAWGTDEKAFYYLASEPQTLLEFMKREKAATAKRKAAIDAIEDTFLEEESSEPAPRKPKDKKEGEEEDGSEDEDDEEEAPVPPGPPCVIL